MLIVTSSLHGLSHYNLFVKNHIYVIVSLKDKAQAVLELDTLYDRLMSVNLSGPYKG